MRDNQPSDKPPLPPLERSAFELTEAKFDDMMKNAWESMSAVMKGEKSLSPVVFVFYKEVEDELQIGDIKLAVLVITNDFNDWKTKSATLRQIGEMCFEKQWFPIAAFLGSEVWVGKNTSMMPSQDPQRVEAIVLAGISSDYTKMRLAHLVRAEDKTISMGEDIATPEGATAEAPLLGQLFAGFGRKADELVESRPDLMEIAKSFPRKRE